MRRVLDGQGVEGCKGGEEGRECAEIRGEEGFIAQTPRDGADVPHFADFVRNDVVLVGEILRTWGAAVLRPYEEKSTARNGCATVYTRCVLVAMVGCEFLFSNFGFRFSGFYLRSLARQSWQMPPTSVRETETWMPQSCAICSLSCS
jgi:hypothetical protein